MMRERRDPGNRTDASAWLRMFGHSVVADKPPPAQIPVGAFELATSASIPVLVAAHYRRHATTAPTEFGELLPRSRLQLLNNRQALFHLARTLDDVGVRWLVFKGPVLARKYYAPEHARQYNDIDVLVHPEDLEKAIDALVAAGARQIDLNWSLISTRQQGEISLVWQSSLIDLHWHFYSSAALRRDCRVDIRGVLARRTLLDMDGFSVYVPDDLDTVIFVATHALLSGGHRIRWCIDFALAYRSVSSDERSLVRRAREHEALLLLVVMVERTESTLGVGLLDISDHVGVIDHVWLWICSVTTRIAPPENDLFGGISGRAVFGATRANAVRSLACLVRNLWSAARNRRAQLSDADVDRSILHQPGGSDADRRSWLLGAIADGAP